MKFTTSALLALFMATFASSAAIPVSPRKGISAMNNEKSFEVCTNPISANGGVVATTYKGAVIVSGGTPTRDFDSLSEEEKEEVLAACPSFVDGVDGEIDANCF